MRLRVSARLSMGIGTHIDGIGGHDDGIGAHIHAFRNDDIYGIRSDETRLVADLTHGPSRVGLLTTRCLSP